MLEGRRCARQPQVYHRLQAIKAEITAGPYGVAGWQAEEEAGDPDPRPIQDVSYIYYIYILIIQYIAVHLLDVKAKSCQVEEDLMDKMVVEADCIPGGIDGEAPDRKQVLDRREIQGVLDFGQKIKSEGNEATKCLVRVHIEKDA